MIAVGVMLKAWMFIFYVGCVLCSELITHSEETDQVCVCVCQMVCES